MLRVRDVSVAVGGGVPAPLYLKSNGLDVGFPLSMSLTLRKLFWYSVFRRQQEEILRNSSGLTHTHAHAQFHTILQEQVCRCHCCIPAEVPDSGHALRQVAPAGADHLVGDLQQQRRHSLRGVVVARDAVDHPDAAHQTGNKLQHPGLSGSRAGGGGGEKEVEDKEEEEGR